MANTPMQILFEELEKLGCKFGEVFTSYHLGIERKAIIDAYNDGATNDILNRTGERYFRKFSNQ